MKTIDRGPGLDLRVGSLPTTTAQSDIYAFFFNSKGLMGDLGLQGTKISKIKK